MEDFDEICMDTWQVMQILAKSYGHGACSSLQRLHIKRVMADSFRLKRGRIQASGAQNASGLRISMRSARIHRGSWQVPAKSDRNEAFLARTGCTSGGQAGHGSFPAEAGSNLSVWG